MYFYVILIIWNWNETEFRDPKMKVNVGVLKALLKCSIHPPGSSTASPMAEGTQHQGHIRWPLAGLSSVVTGDKLFKGSPWTEINHRWGQSVQRLMMCSQRAGQELLFSHCNPEKYIKSVQIHGTVRNWLFVVVEREAKETKGKNPLKFYPPGLDFKKQKVIPEERLLMRGFFSW